MRIGVVSAMEAEIEEIRASFSGEIEHRVGDLCITEVPMFSHSLFLVISGIGKTRAAIAAQALICRFDCEIIVNTGLAGSLRDVLSAGDAVLCRQAFFHDFDPVIAEQLSGTYHALFSDARLLTLAEGALSRLSIPHRTGLVATGDFFVCDKKSKEDILARTGADCVDMEAAAICLAAHASGLPFVSIKFISDSADEEAQDDFTDSLSRYAHRCAAIIVEMVRTI